MRLRLVLVICFLATASSLYAELKLSSVFSDSMVLQRDKPIHVWGWTKPGQSVTAEIAGHSSQTTADSSGRFDLEIDPLPAGGPHELSIQADELRTIGDVLIGEVWLCSGQSNMQWSVGQSNDADLESLAADYPLIRLISVPQVGTQEPQSDFEGRWEACNPQNVKDFSAVGFFFGRQLRETLDVPIGLIDNAWGGSAAEAWVRRDLLEADEKYTPLLEKWEMTENTYDHAKATADWEARRKKWVENGKKGNQPRQPRNVLAGQHRPANLYNGVLKPILGYTIRGVIWYQGESNSGRAYQYRDLFPLMIQSWRDEWKQGDLPFYWVQLADFMAEASEPKESSWAELREAQTMTMDKLVNTGEAVIIDLGEASDIHPKNKQDVAKRLARWALAKDYGYDIVYQSPRYESMSVKDGKANVKFVQVGSGLDTFDVRELIGFTIAGEDKKFVHANAKMVSKDTISVWSDEVKQPVAVRYAWADNPVANVQNKAGLPLTPFRTDDWKGITADVMK